MNSFDHPQATTTHEAGDQHNLALDRPQFRYDAAMAQSIEQRWQNYWKEHGTFWAANVAGDLTDGNGHHAGDRPSFFAMDMFPYPSGKGLHVGHPLGYLATDVVSRYHRMKGENVLHAMGYDAFGLPAEQYAVQTGQHPRITTQANIANMRRQLSRMGLSLDDRREFATIDPLYVRWTQWIFSRIYESWYDVQAPREDGGVGKARPISELIDEFKQHTRPIPGFENEAWDDLSKREQADVLNEFRLAYISHSPVNWCPGLGTVLANEEVTAEGKSERGNYPVFKRELRQWSMRITSYAQRLLDDLDGIDWPEKVKIMQRNWIGRSRGAHVHFSVEGGASGTTQDLLVYTTRPDTLFGTTFAVVNVNHEILCDVPSSWDENTPQSWKQGYSSPFEAVRAYCTSANNLETQVGYDQSKSEKTGQFTGLYAVNPITGARLPIFTAQYVLADYGTGAIMAVPGGDQRDYDFARALDLPIIYTVEPTPDSGETLADYEGAAPFVSHDGVVINSCVEATRFDGQPLSINGLNVDDAIERVIAWLESSGVGSASTRYRLRDWLFSRQRYWGEPFPIVYDDEGVAHLLDDSHLPINLPQVPDYSPRTFDPEDADSNPEAPLSRNQEWVDVTLDLGDGLKTYHRDTNTMPNWAGSCCYYLRYLNPNEADSVVDGDEYAYWMGAGRHGCDDAAGGVDLYIGGVEHAVLHLLYARFWHKVLFDLGFVSSNEPFHKLFNQGMIQAYAYTDERGQYVSAAEVEEVVLDSGDIEYRWQGQSVQREFGKMGKSLKNIITPDDMYESYGADTFRLYEMSMGPLDESRPWNTRNVVGGMRFLQRLWRNVVDEQTGELNVSDEPCDSRLLKVLNNTIVDVTEQMEQMHPNTAIAKLIVLNNELTSFTKVPRSAVEPLILMLSPIAPHICEELWHRLGHAESLAYEPWPVADERYVGQDTITAVVQIGGKVRARLEVSPDIDAQSLQDLALKEVADRIAGKTLVKVIVRAPKIVSLVVK